MSSEHASPLTSNPDDCNPVTGNLEFLRSLGLAFATLLASALLLVAVALTTSPELAVQRESASGEGLRPWRISGSDLTPRLGAAVETDSGGLRITRLEQGLDTRGIFTRRTGFKASDYPYLEYDINGRNGSSYYYFIWRNSENPEQVHNLPLSWNERGPAVSLLTRSPEWRGTIIEAGLDIYGDLGEANPVVQYLTLRPTSYNALLQTVISEWTAIRTWTQKSAHHLRGTPWSPVISPTVAFASWAGIALAISVLLRQLITFRLALVAALTAFLAWVSFDLLWQYNLSWQLKDTARQFAGKSQQEKHLADKESELYRYAQHLKNEVLPEPGVKIFLLHDSEERGYRKLKAQYYLLPHNIFNYYTYPRRSRVREGDYLLVLDEIEGLKFRPKKNQLRWGNQKLAVEKLDDHPLGQVYRVRASK